MQHENRAGFLFSGNPAVCISDSIGLYKQCTPLPLELFDFFVNELRRYTEMLRKTLLAEKLFCAAVDKFTVGPISLCVSSLPHCIQRAIRVLRPLHGILLMQTARVL